MFRPQVQLEPSGVLRILACRICHPALVLFPRHVAVVNNPKNVLSGTGSGDCSCKTFVCSYLWMFQRCCHHCGFESAYCLLHKPGLPASLPPNWLQKDAVLTKNAEASDIQEPSLSTRILFGFPTCAAHCSRLKITKLRQKKCCDADPGPSKEKRSLQPSSDNPHN